MPRRHPGDHRLGLATSSTYPMNACRRRSRHAEACVRHMVKLSLNVSMAAHGLPPCAGAAELLCLAESPDLLPFAATLGGVDMVRVGEIDAEIPPHNSVAHAL